MGWPGLGQRVGEPGRAGDRFGEFRRTRDHRNARVAFCQKVLGHRLRAAIVIALDDIHHRLRQRADKNGGNWQFAQSIQHAV